MPSAMNSIPCVQSSIVWCTSGQPFSFSACACTPGLLSVNVSALWPALVPIPLKLNRPMVKDRRNNTGIWNVIPKSTTMILPQLSILVSWASRNAGPSARAWNTGIFVCSIGWQWMCISCSPARNTGRRQSPC